jgi:DNA replication and repair protein RecF
MLAELQLRNFRCFESLAVEFAPGFNFFIGRNGQGKTSILEAACVLL